MSKAIWILGGYGSSSREGNEKLENVVKGMLVDYPSCPVTVFETYKRSCLDDLDEAIKGLPTGTKLNVYMKSYGCKRFLKVWEDMPHTLSQFKHVQLIFVDAHGSTLGDGEVGPSNKNQPIVIPDYMIGDNMDLFCIDQHRKAPTGAEIIAKNCYPYPITHDKITHKNIVNDQATRKVIKMTLDRLFDTIQADDMGAVV